MWSSLLKVNITVFGTPVGLLVAVYAERGWVVLRTAIVDKGDFLFAISEEEELVSTNFSLSAVHCVG